MAEVVSLDDSLDEIKILQDSSESGSIVISSQLECWSDIPCKLLWSQLHFLSS